MNLPHFSSTPLVLNSASVGILLVPASRCTENHFSFYCFTDSFHTQDRGPIVLPDTPLCAGDMAVIVTEKSLLSFPNLLRSLLPEEPFFKGWEEKGKRGG